ncbi:MAG: hypothetical protein HY013_16655 [Candidatus Solibacter usitatus]|nr:hypothetical protein [Candidatus Solibacter usitatus]
MEYAAGHIDEARSVAGVGDVFEEWNPGFRLRWGVHEGQAEWEGCGVVWIQEGRGEVWLPRGYRTKEGDGDPLPGCYRPEPAPSEWIDAVRYAAGRVDGFSGELRQALAGLCARLKGDRYIGDCANDLWAWLEHDGVAPDRECAAFVEVFERWYDQVGWSVKSESSWEPVQAGDQILLTSERLRVRGRFRYWAIDSPRQIGHISALRRLRYLRDTAGGCNFQWNAFRRMSLTYYPRRGATPENPDGINQVNSHFVNIAAETSRAHYHPRVAIGGGKPQGEFYFVLDPAVYALSTYGRAAGLELWPDIDDRARRIHLPLRPGSVVYITPGTGHRGVDVFANVVVLPGYKLKNQVFL